MSYLYNVSSMDIIAHFASGRIRFYRTWDSLMYTLSQNMLNLLMTITYHGVQAKTKCSSMTST